MIPNAKILADSVSPNGFRFTTFEAVYPRIILAELNTHRALSRVSASSRAIPVAKMIARVNEHTYVPTHWGKNQKGMRAEQDVDAETAEKAAEIWRWMRDQVIVGAFKLLDLGIHKQITNRPLEAFMWHPTVISATEWSNFFHLRDHKDAHPDFRDLAHHMRELYDQSTPEEIDHGEWHQPYIGPEDYDLQLLREGDSQTLMEYLCKVSVGRVARVSTLTHDGKRDLTEDVALHDRMMQGGHSSPYEHVARPMLPVELELFKQKKMRWDPEHRCWIWVGAKYRVLVDQDEYREVEPWRYGPSVPAHTSGEYTHFLGNIQGWVQLRKQIPFEEDILGSR